MAAGSIPAPIVATVITRSVNTITGAPTRGYRKCWLVAATMNQLELSPLSNLTSSHKGLSHVRAG